MTSNDKYRDNDGGNSTAKDYRDIMVLMTKMAAMDNIISPYREITNKEWRGMNTAMMPG